MEKGVRLGPNACLLPIHYTTTLTELHAPLELLEELPLLRLVPIAMYDGQGRHRRLVAPHVGQRLVEHVHVRGELAEEDGLEFLGACVYMYERH